MLLRCVVPILFCLFYYTSGLPKVDPLVVTNLGIIRGMLAPEGDYSMFLGIPYATVDPRKPFGLSVPHPGFNDTFNALDDSVICPQVEYFSNVITGSLDCLRLNIYVPNTATSVKRLPVLVWFHGGAFSTGHGGRSFYGPQFLVKHNVILVTVNYRLGPYGFFCLDVPEIPGNQGLKDQVTALRWVKNNIKEFGGDSDSITIFGESAGGSSVNHHLIYGEDDLFHKVIIQSVPAISPFSLSNSNPNAPLRLAEYLGYESNGLIDALKFLSSVHTDIMIAAAVELNLQFRPCVEKQFENVEHLITDYPINVKVPKERLVPILIGYTDNEALFSHGTSDLEGFRTLFRDNLNTFFNFNSDQLETMEQTVRQFYIGDEDISERVRQKMIDFISDFRYIHPIYRTMNIYLEEGISSIYHYVFSYDGGRNLFKSRSNITSPGAAHTDELGYLFEVAVLNNVITPEDQLTIDRMTALWTNFAKYSVPTPEINELLPVHWKAVTKNDMSYLDIGSELIVGKRPFYNRVAFWDLFYILNEKFQVGYRNVL